MSVVIVCNDGIKISIIGLGMVKHNIMTSCNFKIFSIDGIADYLIMLSITLLHLSCHISKENASRAVM